MSNTTTSKVTPIRLFVASLIVLVLAAIWGWYRLVYTSPSHVFNRMLSNTLATPGVSKLVSQNDSSQQLDQQTQLVTSPLQAVRSVATLHQGASGDTVVITDSVGTTKADYVRYTSIKTSQKTTDGKDFNFAPVLNIWGKADANDTSSGGAQLYNQTVLGVLPVGNITANQRHTLLNQIKNDQVFATDYGNVKKSTQSGRSVYTYNVGVKPVAYVSMLKTFARDIGLKQLEAVDPSQYADSPPLNFTFDIDVLSGELIKITYNDSSKRTETFSSYGARAQINIPDKTVPVEDLQSKLQQIQ